MNTNQLYEAIGEVAEEKLLHSEEAVCRSHRPLRLIGILAAVVAALSALTLVVNAATEGAMLNTLRMWLNGEAIQADDERIGYSAGENEEDVFQPGVDSNDYELMAARTNEQQETLLIQRYYSDEDGQFLGVVLQLNRVEERDGRLILCYGDDEIDVTEQLRSSNECTVDYSVYWSGKLKSHVLITVQRGTNGQYLVFSEPAG